MPIAISHSFTRPLTHMLTHPLTHMLTRTLLLLSLSLHLTNAQPSDSLAFFGIQTHFGQGRPDLDSVMNLVEAAGIKAIRDEVYWHEVEQVQGVFSFSPSHDAYIQAALDRGIVPLIILDYGNALYGGTPRDSGAREAFARYCQAVVNRYGPMGVRHYEVWNEPNLCIPTFCPWSPGPNATEYYELLKVAYTAIKEADSTAFVLGCATSPLDEPETAEKVPGDVFIQRVFALGGGAYMDAVSFHQYPVSRTPEEWIPAECAHVRTAMGATQKPMWITEIGQHTSTAYAGVTETRQAQLIARTYLVGRIEPGLQRISWYDLMDDCPDDANAECRFGILRLDKSQKPAYAAIATAVSLTEGLPVTSSTVQSGTLVVRFGASGNEVVAVWTSTGAANVNVPVSTAYAKVVDWMGTTTAIVRGGSSTISIQASENPQYVVALPTGPALNEFRISPGDCILDSAQSMSFTASGRTGEGIPVTFGVSDVTWSFIGTGGALYSGNYFVANAPGSGIVIGTFGSFADTARVTIVPKRGTYTLNTMESVLGWGLALAKVDTTETVLLTDPNSYEGNASFRLNYKFIYDGLTGFTASLRPNPPIMLPGRPDSLNLAIRGDSSIHKLVYTLEDQFGATFITVPTNLNAFGRWQVFRRVPRPSGGSFEYPYSIRSIDLLLYPPVSTPIGTIVAGTIHLDLLTAKFNVTTAVEELRTSVPQGAELLQNYPNPFNPLSNLGFRIADFGSVKLSVFDLLGREVAVLVNGILSPGTHAVVWDASAFPSGIYLCRLTTSESSITKRMVLLR